MLVLAMIIVWFLSTLITQNEIKVPVQHARRCNVDTATEIKFNVLKVYHSNMDDRREQIVHLLRRLCEYEDPGEFLERNSYIHEFLFNHYVERESA